MESYEDGVEGLIDYAEDGVDLTLVRCTLSLTPEQRVREMQSCVNSLQAIREANARS